MIKLIFLALLCWAFVVGVIVAAIWISEAILNLLTQ